jgi:hypothetical protein
MERKWRYARMLGERPNAAHRCHQLLKTSGLSSTERKNTTMTDKNEAQLPKN